MHFEGAEFLYEVVCCMPWLKFVDYKCYKFGPCCVGGYALHLGIAIFALSTLDVSERFSTCERSWISWIHSLMVWDLYSNMGKLGSIFNCSVRVCVVCVICDKSLIFCRSSAFRSIWVVCSWDACSSCCIICDVSCDVYSISLSSRVLVSSVDIVWGKYVGNNCENRCYRMGKN